MPYEPLVEQALELASHQLKKVITVEREQVRNLSFINIYHKCCGTQGVKASGNIKLTFNFKKYQQ